MWCNLFMWWGLFIININKFTTYTTYTTYIKCYVKNSYIRVRVCVTAYESKYV